MKKSEFRKLYKAKRQQLTNDQVDSFSLAIANQSLGLHIWNFENYHLFISIEEQKEVNTEYLLHILQGKDKNVIVAKSDFSNLSMSHFLLTDTTVFKKNGWHIPEPVDGFKIHEEQIEVVFIPLLACDALGNRVGYGKGFYDRFLSKCKPNTIKVGLSFFEPSNVLIDSESNDIKLDYLISPLKVFSFKS